MSLVTRCPACTTVFRVAPDQLKVSNGWVRCGQCSEVFNALEQITELTEEVPAIGAPTAADIAQTHADFVTSTLLPGAEDTPPTQRQDPTWDLDGQADAAAAAAHLWRAVQEPTLPPEPVLVDAAAAPTAAPEAPSAPVPAEVGADAPLSPVAPTFFPSTDDVLWHAAAWQAPVTPPMAEPLVTPPPPMSVPTFTEPLADMSPVPSGVLPPLSLGDWRLPVEEVSPAPEPASVEPAPLVPLAAEPDAAPPATASAPVLTSSSSLWLEDASATPVTEAAPVEAAAAEPATAAPALPLVEEAPAQAAPPTEDAAALVAAASAAAANADDAPPLTPINPLPAGWVAAPPAPLPPAPAASEDPSWAVTQQLVPEVRPPAADHASTLFPDTVAQPREWAQTIAPLSATKAADLDDDAPLPLSPLVIIPTSAPAPVAGGYSSSFASAPTPEALPVDSHLLPPAEAGAAALAAAATPAAGAGPAAAASATAAAPAADGEDAGPSTLPEFLRQAERERRWNHPLVRLLLVLGVVVAMFFLGFQLLIQQRNNLAVQFPAMRSSLLKMCEFSGCELTSPLAIDQIVLVSSQISQTPSPGVLHLEAELHNRARYPVRAPALELTFTDVHGQVLVRKTIPAAQVHPDINSLEPGENWQVNLFVSVGDLPVSGFSVEVFYP